MTTHTAEPAAYLDTVRERLRGAGYQLLEVPAGVEIRAHERGFKPSRFGFVDTFVTVEAAGPGTAETLREFSGRWFAADGAARSGPPLGLFAQLVSYPVLVVESAADELRSAITSHSPKHWSALEFPSVVDLAAGELLCYSGTPVWGAAYYKKSRADVQALFAPGTSRR